MKTKEALEKIRTELHRVLHLLDEDRAEALIHSLEKAKRIFVTGQGRSGLIARAFAARLTHLGKTAFAVGDCTTPAIGKGDLLVACSSSGSTKATCLHAKSANAAGARVAAVTSRRNSPLSRLANVVLVLDAPAKDRFAPRRSVQFGSTLFEQACLLTMDAVSLVLASRLRQSAKQMMSRHANLE